MAYATVRPIPAWNTPVTVLFFLVSGLLTGALAVATALAVRYWRAKGELQAEALRALVPFTGVGAALLVAAIVVGGLWLLHLNSTLVSRAASESLAMLSGSLLGLTLARVLAGMVLPLGVLVYAWRRATVQPQAAAPWVIVSFVLVLAGDLMARAIFFLTAVHI